MYSPKYILDFFCSQNIQVGQDMDIQFVLGLGYLNHYHNYHSGKNHSIALKYL